MSFAGARVADQTQWVSGFDPRAGGQLADDGGVDGWPMSRPTAAPPPDGVVRKAALLRVELGPHAGRVEPPDSPA